MKTVNRSLQRLFGWSEKGADEGEAVFCNQLEAALPASIQLHRWNLNAISRISRSLNGWGSLPKIIEEQVLDGNTENYKMIAELYSIGNGLKVYDGIYKGLNDPYLIARKNDFEKFLNPLFCQSKTKSEIWTYMG
ncbi:MAG: hypothetical protein IPN18_06920 [Ignavibacteriales bacterium]|nr:hypothetical protein [Ignavibacteriales bacterium]